ncbi:MAG TPA: methionine--tRNA ligase [Fimbriimonadaceae bacterium]|nr:methionine--tRNA ligase [Fimbriimonadaceae bacterium]
MPQKSVMTAIPYVNGTPHIGTLLSTLTGDVTARYFRLCGHDVWFQSGTDENGLKIKEAAERSGQLTGEFVTGIAQRFIDIFKSYEISYDDFVRTTEPRHVKASQALFAKLQENGYIYEGLYEGWYDVSAETFFKDEELIDGKSPNGNEVRWVSETNYFFKLSAFQDRLLEAYASGKIRVVPETRQNEVLSFINQGLRDTCISRSNPGWGIEVPGDPSQVIYVWFDAVINYLTSVGYPESGFEKKWPPAVQWVGKDILTRFHATLWPAMLMGIGAEIPPVVAAHAWILLGGEKLSKSTGHMVEPVPLRDELATKAGIPSEIATDAVRYYLVATMGYENDSTFTYEDFDRRYNSDLANDLGNALNRSLAMSHKFVGGTVPEALVEAQALTAIHDTTAAYRASMELFRLDHAASHAVDLVRFLNKYIDTRAPWALAKTGDPALPAVLRSMLMCLRSVEALVRPFMPAASDAIAAQLGVPPLMDLNAVGTDASLPAGTVLQPPTPIFPRLDLARESEQAHRLKPVPPSPAKQSTIMSEAIAPPTEITIDEFAKVKLRVGRIFEAAPVEGSDKLMQLQVVIGEEKRQIVAGIKANYTPEELIGRQIVVCVNLKPAKLRGVESQGMLLAATDTDGGAILLQPEKEAPEGAPVK